MLGYVVWCVVWLLLRVGAPARGCPYRTCCCLYYVHPRDCEESDRLYFLLPSRGIGRNLIVHYFALYLCAGVGHMF
jgi:hypothetical protein